MKLRTDCLLSEEVRLRKWNYFIRGKPIPTYFITELHLHNCRFCTRYRDCFKCYKISVGKLRSRMHNYRPVPKDFLSGATKRIFRRQSEQDTAFATYLIYSAIIVGLLLLGYCSAVTL